MGGLSFKVHVMGRKRSPRLVPMHAGPHLCCSSRELRRPSGPSPKRIQSIAFSHSVIRRIMMLVECKHVPQALQIRKL